jgi:ATP synthase protein I
LLTGRLVEGKFSRGIKAVGMQPYIITTRAAAYRIVKLQFLIITVITILLLATGFLVPAYSAFVGGLAYTGPNALFVSYALRRGRVQDPGAVVRGLFFGEAVKLVLTALIFAICFQVIKPLFVPALFIMFIAMLLVNVIGMAMVNTD